MPRGRRSPLVIAVSAVAFASALAACTPGGQFDPTEVISTDVFNTKKKITGDREPLFPQGVPGTETGVPPDLVKGYQPPPEQAPEAAADPAGKTAAAAAAAEKPKPKAKTSTRPKVAKQTVPPPPPMPTAAQPAVQGHDPAWDRAPIPGAPPAAAAQAHDPVWDRIPTSPIAPRPQQPPPPAQQTQQ